MSDKEFTAGQSEYWKKRWVDKRVGWDQGQPHKLIPEVISMAKKQGLVEGAEILEPGSGRGHQGAAIAKLGFAVTSYDVSPIAVLEGSELYSSVNSFKMEQGDCFEVNRTWSRKYDGIFDRAVLCALPSENRRKYLTVQTEYLKPKGLFLTIPFREIFWEEGKEGPPFAISMEELQDLFFEDYTLLSARDFRYSSEESRIKKESIMIWQKK